MAATAAATSMLKNILIHSLFPLTPPPFSPPTPKFSILRRLRLTTTTSSSVAAITNFCTTTTAGPSSIISRNNKKKKKKEKQRSDNRIVAESVVKRRTRSDKEFNEESVLRYGDSATHIPVMLGEVLEVFASLQLRSFVDCTLGAAGHSSAIIQSHPEMQLYVGLDVDPVAQEKALDRINVILHGNRNSTNDLKTHILLNNFRDIKSVLHKVDEKLQTPGLDGILMDLGMSSMQVNNAERGFSVLSNGPLDMRMNPQASLKAEDILNSWPDTEVGRILRDYGEESNWRFLQNKIVEARQSGGLHSTGELVDLIRNSTSRTKGEFLLESSFVALF
uniref:Putative S-adenosyl-L-methionine-dependent methyltransferase, MraW n=1 Tax=Davidia involucrata TaxID=16924 RepID=A0A5B7BDW1_DAVIN